MGAASGIDLLRRHRDLARALLTRFAVLSPEVLARHRGKLDRNLLAQNPFVGGPRDPYPTEDPRLEDAWRRFACGCLDAPGEARLRAFLDAEKGLLDASYVRGYRMLGRDWEPERRSGWELLGHVTTIDWSEGVIADLSDRLDFTGLSANVGLPWTEGLISRFADRWDWEGLARNESLPWSEALLDRFPQLPLSALSGNARFPWTERTLERFADAIDWQAISRNRGILFTDEWVARFGARLSIQGLAENPAYPSLARLLASHADELDWSRLAASHFIEWTAALVRAFEDRIDWQKLSANAGLWTLALLDELMERVDFGAEGLSLNTRMTWTNEILERHADQLDRREISRNPSVWRSIFEPLLDGPTLDQFLGALEPSRTR